MLQTFRVSPFCGKSPFCWQLQGAVSPFRSKSPLCCKLLGRCLHSAVNLHSVGNFRVLCLHSAAGLHGAVQDSPSRGRTAPVRAAKANNPAITVTQLMCRLTLGQSGTTFLYHCKLERCDSAVGTPCFAHGVLRVSFWVRMSDVSITAITKATQLAGIYTETCVGPILPVSLGAVSTRPLLEMGTVKQPRGLHCLSQRTPVPLAACSHLHPRHNLCPNVQFSDTSRPRSPLNVRRFHVHTATHADYGVLCLSMFPNSLAVPHSQRLWSLYL
jgi:hypothetical protein